MTLSSAVEPGETNTPRKRILVANRGAIAVRIMRTLASMQIESVAVFSESDRQSLHVQRADYACSLGEGTATDTYLSSVRILEIAREYGVDAIHPGYGFLSENSEFVRLCEASGIAFIGPTADQIEEFGLKHRARKLAKDYGVPLLPGTEVLADSTQAADEAKSIGYPVMLKSTAGGGGIGMQLCFNEVELLKNYAAVSQLSQKNFANADLFLEKFVEKARHIEVQIFGDGEGQVISLGERDCSAQRRNQKVLEEAPAPNLGQDTRDSLCAVACRLGSAVNYRNAGTVEFILDAETGRYYFLEVNTRLQVEHGVTEMIYGVDLVSWMIQLSFGQSPIPDVLPEPSGHSIQARVYAENPVLNFQPSAGLLSEVKLPANGAGRRLDHWIESGTTVSAFYDPMLAKVIAHADSRALALDRLDEQLSEFGLYGIETNVAYLRTLLSDTTIRDGLCLTSTLKSVDYQARVIDVVKAGTLTTIQDYPGRSGYWPVGIPPSGPFDDYHFRLGNSLLGNPESCAGLEMTLDGVTLVFQFDTSVVITGAQMPALLDSQAIPHAQVADVKKGQTLTVAAVSGGGMRSYLHVKGGINCPLYLGSSATFTLGKFGGHAGRALRSGDVLRVSPESTAAGYPSIKSDQLQLPALGNHWQINVVTGPHGTDEFFDDIYLKEFYASVWSVHFNSSRTGVRLLGPRPQWSRDDGGEAGMHPSNLHDNAYAFGTIDFTGDMPVILGPDGPSLGGFVCPATVASADRWKLGQLKPGDTLCFVPVTYASAVKQLAKQNQSIKHASALPDYYELAPTIVPFSQSVTISGKESNTLDIRLRRAGDSWLLIEFGAMVLDIALRFAVQRLMTQLEHQAIAGVLELTPGIRSLQIHYDCLKLTEADLIEKVTECSRSLGDNWQDKVPSRIVHLPLSWDDENCKTAIEKYDQVVRKDAPWYPSNIEFIRRINGLDSIEDVKQVVFDASYLVMGLGDVYLGAPVATPLDPRHRLVTTKYNPARTWTAENSVGIGGSYLCIYGMEGPGGYQFVGRTLQMWNIYKKTKEFGKPWLLRFFDQIKFYPVSGEELQTIRRDFPHGNYPLKIEHTEFDLGSYGEFLSKNKSSIDQFSRSRQQAFNAELQHWKDTGQYQFEETVVTPSATESKPLPGRSAIDSPASGSVWKILVSKGEQVDIDQPVLVLESMKMEIEVRSNTRGVVEDLLCKTGSIVETGSRLIVLKE